jgi:hydrogenase nickel incorporation protein HypA/HybF
MHEVGIMEQTLEIALDYARDRGANQVHRLVMRVGELSGVVPEALLFAFDVVVTGTIAEGATLEIDSIPARCYCCHCQKEFQPIDIVYECPTCHELSWEIRQGKELELASLEIS